MVDDSIANVDVPWFSVDSDKNESYELDVIK